MRTYVPFETLWSMPIELPYSLLLRAGGYAWSCGQLALDEDSNVLAPGDLSAQSRIVCDYIEEILTRGDVPISAVRRLRLYYTDDGPGALGRMCDCFRQRFGDGVLLDPIPVPYFYYDGVVLEVELFAAMGEGQSGARSHAGTELRWVGCGDLVWVSLESRDESFEQTIEILGEELARLALSRSNLLCEHWFVPSDRLPHAVAAIEGLKARLDAGGLVDAGGHSEHIRAGFIFVRNGPVIAEMKTIDEIRLVTRSSNTFTWIQARSLDPAMGLVDQTGLIMQGLQKTLDGMDLSFAQVVKSTAHYVGGNSAQELHENMRIRNRYYTKPGPASTGLPVFGFADRASRIAVDVTAMRDSEK